MVCAQSKGDSNRLLSSLGNRGNISVLLGYVDVAIGNTSKAREVVNQQFKILVGDCQDMNFGNDDWTEMEQLRLHYPRIYVLARHN